MAEVEARLFNTANSSQVAALAGGYDVQFQDIPNGLGSFSFRIDVADTDRSSVAAGLTFRCLLGGTARFAGLIESVDPAPVDETTEGLEAVLVSGSGICGEFNGWATLPVAGEASTIPPYDERVFAWYGPDYTPDGSWETPSVVAVQGWGSTFYTGLPAGWTDPSAVFIWSSLGDEDDAPAGVCLFRETVTVDAGAKYLEWGADNYGVLYVNGRRVGDGYDFRKKFTYDFETLAGELLLAWYVENAADDGPPGGNPGALIGSMRQGGSEGAVIWRTSTAMDLLAYPSALPEMSVPDVLDILGDLHPGFADWTVTYNTGVSAITVGTEMLVRIGDDSWWDVLAGLAETLIDFDPDPTGKTLQVWPKGHTTTPTLTLVAGESTAGQSAPDTVNVSELAWDRPRPEYDAVVARWSRGWFVRPTVLPSKPRWKALGIGQVEDPDRATELVDGFLAAAQVATATIGFVPVDSTEWPYAAFTKWSTLAVPTENLNSTEDQAVAAITVKGDENGDAEFVVEVGSLVEARQTYLERWIARASRGGADGLSLSATPPLTASTAKFVGAASTPSAGGVSHYIGSNPGPVDGATSTAPCPFVGKVTTLRLVGEGGTGTSTVTVTADSVLVATLAGSGDGVIDYENLSGVSWNTRTMIELVVTTANHTALHVLADVADIR